MVVKWGKSAEETIRSLNSNIHTGGWVNRVHWALVQAVDDVDGGRTWTAYRKQSRKDVLLQVEYSRSLAHRPGRRRVFQLPNEMAGIEKF